MNISKMYVRLIILVNFIIILVLNFQVTYGQVSECQTNGFVYIWVQPLPIPVEDDSGLTEFTPEPYLLALRSQDPLGLILPDNAYVTLFSDRQLQLTVYKVRPNANPSGYRYVNSNLPAASTSSDREQSVFNQIFSDSDLANFSIKCNLTSLLSTRPISIIGGRTLENLENEQLANNNSITRRTMLGTEDFYTHELVYINPNLSFPVSNPPPDIKSTLAFRFGQKDIAFQLISFGESAIDLGIPSLTQPTEYTLITDRQVTAEDIIRVGQDELQASTKNSFSRVQFLEVNTLQSETFFEWLREDAAAVYPRNAVNSVLNPQNFIRLQAAELSQEETDARSFLCQTLSPLDGALPKLFTSDGRFYGRLTSSRVNTIIRVDSEGRLEIQDMTNHMIVEPWLVECSS